MIADVRKTLLKWAERTPEKRLYTFLDERGAEESVLTYGQMAARALGLANVLTRRGLAGERALLLYKPEPEYMVGFLGCLLADVVAVPAYPPIPSRLDRTMPRIQAIAESAAAKIVLSTSDILSFREMFQGLAPAVANLDWVATEAAEGKADVPTFTRVDQVAAFLQYTSGSTGEPRGVMISHGGLAANLTAIVDRLRLGPNDVAVTWLPPYHDMGLVGTLLTAVAGGFHTVWMSPVTFLKRPIRWLEAFSKYRGTAAASPDFGYRLCVRKVTEDDRKKLELSSWRIAGNGAEPVRADTMDAFVKTFGPCGFERRAFCPMYGLAESTVGVSYGASEHGPTVRQVERYALEQRKIVFSEGGGPNTTPVVSCGPALAGHRIAIADPESLALLPDEHVGEIMLRGPSVAIGYLDQPELTERTFGVRIGDGSERWTRTGDLGFLASGNLFVVGRLKDLVILRGRNIAPSDIEAVVEAAHGFIRAGTAAAFTVDRSGEEQLVVVVEFERRAPPSDPASEAEEKKWASRRKNIVIPEHEGPPGERPDHRAAIGAIKDAIGQEFGASPLVVLVRVGSALKTSSGKIQRARAREVFLEGKLEELARG